MIVYLMRHCLAKPGARDDKARGLTPHGATQCEDMAAFLVRQIGRVDIVISSPFARAVETAKIMGEALGAHMATTAELVPGAKPAESWKEIERLAQASSDVLVVGHHPDISGIVDELAGATGIGHSFKHGSIAAVDVPTKVLLWLVDHAMVMRDVHVDAEEASNLIDILLVADAGLALAEALESADEYEDDDEGEDDEFELLEGWVTIDGAHVFIDDSGVITKGPPALVGRSHKSVIAQRSMVKTVKEHQDIAERSEQKLANSLGLTKSADNKPFDLQKGHVGVEVKTMVHGHNAKITMSKAALARKQAEIKTAGLKKTFTVVVDMRGGRKTAAYYVSQRLGSLRLGSMTPTSLTALRSMIRAAI